MARTDLTANLRKHGHDDLEVVARAHLEPDASISMLFRDGRCRRLRPGA